MRNKTDKADARGIAHIMRTGVELPDKTLVFAADRGWAPSTGS
jgi:hypothetical protein